MEVTDDVTIADLLGRDDALPLTVSVEEAGRILGLSRRSAYRAVERGELPVLRLGRRLLVPTAKLLVMLGVRSGPLDYEGISDEKQRTT